LKRRWTSWLAWALVALFACEVGAVLALDASTSVPTEPEDQTLVGDVSLLVAFAAFAVVGALVAARQPRNAVGWLFLTIPLFAITGALAEEYAYRALVVSPDLLPGGSLAGWVYLWAWYPSIATIGLVVLLFPNGLPSPRWKALMWVYVAVAVLGTAGASIYPGPLEDSGPGWPDNPLGIEGMKGFLDAAEAAVGVLVILLGLGVVASVVVRWRRSLGDERQQLKWMLVAALILATVMLLDELMRLQVDFLFGLAIALLPVAAGIAMLKYRLYDVDVVISKTLVYGSLTLVLGASYVGFVLAGQWLFSSFAGGSDLAIAVSTLVVAALFLPLRSRLQRFVDRRFYRRRYDAQRTLQAFGARLREEVDLDLLSGDLRGVVAETMQPAHVSLWLRQERSAP
jgi:hypothetical protein